MAITTTTTTGTPAAAPAKFKVGDRVQAVPARQLFGAVTQAKWQSGQWVYEVRYETTNALSTWFESQLKAAAAKGAA